MVHQLYFARRHLSFPLRHTKLIVPCQISAISKQAKSRNSASLLVKLNQVVCSLYGLKLG